MRYPSVSAIRATVASYDIGTIQNIQLFYKSWNAVYLIKTSTGKYALKVQRFAADAEFKQEIAVMNMLNREIPHAHILYTKKGKSLTTCNGKLAYLMEYIEGTHPKSGVTLSLNELRQMGRTIALMHRTKTKSVPTLNNYDMFKKFFSKSPASRERELGKSTLRFLEQQHFYTDPLPRGFTHGDPLSQNMLFRAGKVVAVVDYENSHIAPYVHDLGIALFNTCCADGVVSKRRNAALIAGYESIRKLTTLEKKHLENAALHAALWSLQGLMVMDKARAYAHPNVQQQVRLLAHLSHA